MTVGFIAGATEIHGDAGLAFLHEVVLQGAHIVRVSGTREPMQDQGEWSGGVFVRQAPIKIDEIPIRYFNALTFAWQQRGLAQ